MVQVQGHILRKSLGHLQDRGEEEEEEEEEVVEVVRTYCSAASGR